MSEAPRFVCLASQFLYPAPVCGAPCGAAADEALFFYLCLRAFITSVADPLLAVPCCPTTARLPARDFFNNFSKKKMQQRMRELCMFDNKNSYYYFYSTFK